MLPDKTEVDLFGKRIEAVQIGGCVMFERESFVKTVGRARAARIFGAMSEAFSFLGEDGVDTLVSSGKEYMLCELILADSHSPIELIEYATAWLSAYYILKDHA